MAYAEAVKATFDYCVWVLERVAPIIGMNYFEINLLLFVIVQPLLILLFFSLWLVERERRKRTLVTDRSRP
jgi:hypothetical protein